MSEVRVDLTKGMMWIGERKYYYFDDTDCDSSDDESKRYRWYRESKKYLAVGSDDKHWENTPVEDIDWENVSHDWSWGRLRIHNVAKRRTLTRALEKAKRKIERKKQEAAEREESRDVKAWLKQHPGSVLSTDGLAVQELSSEEFDWSVGVNGKCYIHTRWEEMAVGWWKATGQHPVKAKPALSEALRAAVRKASKEGSVRQHTEEPEDSGSEESSDSDSEQEVSPVKRTKYGTKVLSNDGKHFFTIGVWKSKKYPGCSSVRISVAGRNLLYTLDNAQMAAFRQEISRGEPT
jgi:hypothetical protein